MASSTPQFIPKLPTVSAAQQELLSPSTGPSPSTGGDTQAGLQALLGTEVDAMFLKVDEVG